MEKKFVGIDYFLHHVLMSHIFSLRGLANLLEDGLLEPQEFKLITAQLYDLEFDSRSLISFWDLHKDKLTSRNHPLNDEELGEMITMVNKTMDDNMQTIEFILSNEEIMEIPFFQNRLIELRQTNENLEKLKIKLNGNHERTGIYISKSPDCDSAAAS